MKKLTVLCFAFVFVALLSVSAISKTDDKKPSPLLAEWDLNILAPGQEIPGTFKLEKDGDNFKGVVSTALGDAPLKNIKIKDDNTFTADITVNVQGQSMEGTMNGKLEGDKLSGDINLPSFGAIAYTGKKVEKK